MRSALDGAGGQTLHDLLVEDGEHDHHEDDVDRDGREQGAVLDLSVFAGEVEQADLDCLQ